MVGHKLASAEDLEAEIVGLRAAIAQLKPEQEAAMHAPMRSVEELQSLIDEQIVEIERRRTLMEERKRAIAKLSTQLAAQQEELYTLARTDADLTVKVQEKERQEQDEQKAKYSKQLVSLADWYRATLALHSSISGIHRVEMIRPDYLLVTLSGGGNDVLLPVHLRICQATGKLLAAQIGATSSTPRKGQWKEVIDTAVDNNNIAMLVRQIHFALAKQ